jgi:hypothetical protein
MSRKETMAGWDFAMSDTEFEQQTESTADNADADRGCTELVPMVQSAHWSQTPGQPLSRPDPCFVTQLIATAEHAPQTCSLRRATPADAQAAYRSVTNHNHTTPTGMLTRQTT